MSINFLTKGDYATNSTLQVSSSSFSNEVAQVEQIPVDTLSQPTGISPIASLTAEGEQRAEEVHFEELITRTFGPLLEGDISDTDLIQEYSAEIKKLVMQLSIAPRNLPKLQRLLEIASRLKEYIPGKTEAEDLWHPGRQDAFLCIAKKYADFGQFAVAKDVVDLMDPETFNMKYEALQYFVEKLAETGNMQEAEMTVQLLRESPSCQQHHIDQALLSIANKWIELGETSLAAKTAKSIESTDIALPIVESCAKTFIDQGKRDTALQMALKFQNVESYPNIFLSIMEYLIPAYCRQNQLEEAIAAVDQITAPNIPIDLTTTDNNLRLLEVLRMRGSPHVRELDLLAQKYKEAKARALVDEKCLWLQPLVTNAANAPRARALHVIGEAFQAQGDQEKAAQYFASAEEIQMMDGKINDLKSAAFAFDYEMAWQRPNTLPYEESLVYLDTTAEELDSAVKRLSEVAKRELDKDD